MQKIGIIGSNGFIGSVITDELKNHSITNITKENYELHKNTFFDVLINANGNSKKYWGNLNPIEDFNKSVESVYKSIYDFKYSKYMFISSVDAELKNCSYGFNKFLAEQIVKFHCKNYSIVRLPAIIGGNAEKGIVYDIINKNKIYLTKDSMFMLMDVNEIALILKNLLEKNKLKKLEKFYPSENITIEQIGKFLNIPINYANELRSEYFNYKGNYNTSINYLKNIK